jgi:hypothetical protein
MLAAWLVEDAACIVRGKAVLGGVWYLPPTRMPPPALVDSHLMIEGSAVAPCG